LHYQIAFRELLNASRDRTGTPLAGHNVVGWIHLSLVDEVHGHGRRIGEHAVD